MFYSNNKALGVFFGGLVMVSSLIAALSFDSFQLEQPTIKERAYSTLHLVISIAENTTEDAIDVKGKNGFPFISILPVFYTITPKISRIIDPILTPRKAYLLFQYLRI